MSELVDEKPNISEEAMQLMKFHGSYQQDDREKRSFGSGKAYQFMMRTRQPAGASDNQLYLVMDELADKVSQWGIACILACICCSLQESWLAKVTKGGLSTGG